MSPPEVTCSSGTQRHMHLLHWLLILCIFISLEKFANSNALFGNGRGFPEGSSDDITTEYVDQNNLTILAMFNLTKEQINQIRARNNNTTPQQRDGQHFNIVKEYRVNDIRRRLDAALYRSPSSNNSKELPSSSPYHEMAAYPICNSETNNSSWLQHNNVTIHFSDSLFIPQTENVNLDSAVLRLYKTKPPGSNSTSSEEFDNFKSKRCSDPILDSQIRITVSTVHQIRRNKRVERKKRICNTLMMNVSKTGWVEIDIKRAIYIWEHFGRQQEQHQQRQPILIGYLVIEVHDEEERPLKPGLFFSPPKCDQADFAVPWNYYRPEPVLSFSKIVEVPRSPRLDVRLIGYPSFAPLASSKETYEKLRENVNRQLFITQKNSAESSKESTTLITPTIDNLLDSAASTEMHHNHHKRHSRHHQRHIQKDQLKNVNSQEIDINTTTSVEQSDKQQQKHQQHQHAHRHRLQYHHTRQHHNQHQHNHEPQHQYLDQQHPHFPQQLDLQKQTHAINNVPIAVGNGDGNGGESDGGGTEPKQNMNPDC